MVVRGGGPGSTAGWAICEHDLLHAFTLPAPRGIGKDGREDMQLESDSFRQDRAEVVCYCQESFSDIQPREGFLSPLSDSKEPTSAIGHQMQDPTLLEALDALAEPRGPSASRTFPPPFHSLHSKKESELLINIYIGARCEQDWGCWNNPSVSR